MNQDSRNTIGKVVSDPRKPADGEKTGYVVFRVEKEQGNGKTSPKSKLVIALGQSSIFFESYFEKGSVYGVDSSVRPLNAKVYSDNDPNLESCLENCVIVIEESPSGDDATVKDRAGA